MIPIAETNSLVTPDKERISYTYYHSGYSKAVIIAPGFYNSKDSLLIKKLKDHLIGSYDVIIFDFRGHGESSGLFTWTSKERLDLQEVIDFTAARYEYIGLIGFSMGAATAINLLPENTVIGSFIAVSSPSDISKIEYHLWKLDFKGDLLYTFGREGRIGKGVRPGPFWLKKAKPIKSVGGIKCPVFFIHGDRDWVINYRHSLRLYEEARGHKRIEIVRGGAHAEYLIRDNPEVFRWIEDWLKETLG